VAAVPSCENPDAAATPDPNASPLIAAVIYAVVSFISKLTGKEIWKNN